MTVAYVWAKPSKYMTLLQIRNGVHSVVDIDHYYRRQKPHITLVPPFKIEENTKEDIRNIVDSTDISGSEVHVNGLDVHESPEKPFAIYLSIDLEKEEEVVDMRDQLEQYSRVPINSGVHSHISLFKTRGWWDEVPQEVTDRVSNEIEYYSPINEVNIRGIEVNFKR